MVTVSPSLVGNNDISDCHQFCSLVLERSATTQCKFAFPDGNHLSLVVLDDEGRSLAWTCQFAHQFFTLIIYIYLIYACTQCCPWSFHEYFASSCNCHAILPHASNHFPLFVHFYCLSTFPSSKDVFVSFSTTLTQVREDNGSLALNLRSTRAVSQPFNVHLNSRFLPPGDNTATGECTVCCRSRMNGSWLE